MKIAMVFDGLQYGGIGRVGIDYAKLLLLMGHTVIVYNLNPSLTEMEKEFDNNVKIVHINFPRYMAPEIFSKYSKRGFGFKLLYPCAYAVVTCIDILYKVLLKISAKLSENYDIVIAFSGHYNDLTFVSKKYLKGFKRICWLHGALYGYAIISDGYLNLYNKIKNLVVLNDILQEEVLITNKQLKGLNIKKMYNPSFIAFRQVDNMKVALLKEKYGHFLMMVGRLDKQKDQLSIIKSLEYIREKYGFSEKLLLVGDGNTRQLLEEYVIRHNLQNSVFFEGNRRDVQNYYAASYLFTHASPLDGLPTTLIEALYFEVPIVATDSIPGVREILGNNQYGVITPIGDFKQMGEEIYKMYMNSDVYNEYKMKSKERFLDFSPEKIMQELQNNIL